MRGEPDFASMSDAERAAWHDAHIPDTPTGRVVKRYTRDRAESHLSVRLYPDQIDRLRRLSAREGWTVSSLVRRFIEEKLDELLPEESTTSGSGQPDTYPWVDTSTVASREHAELAS